MLKPRKGFSLVIFFKYFENCLMILSRFSPKRRKSHAGWFYQNKGGKIARLVIFNKNLTNLKENSKHQARLTHCDFLKTLRTVQSILLCFYLKSGKSWEKCRALWSDQKSSKKGEYYKAFWFYQKKTRRKWKLTILKEKQLKLRKLLSKMRTLPCDLITNQKIA